MPEDCRDRRFERRMAEIEREIETLPPAVREPLARLARETRDRHAATSDVLRRAAQDLVAWEACETIRALQLDALADAARRLARGA